MKGILVGSGDYFDGSRFLQEAVDADCLVAVDGGMDHYLDLKITPDILIGDLDSISPNTTKRLEDNEGLIIQKYPKEKDSTDMELALEYLVGRNYKEIIIFGGTGLRLDHTFANLFIMDGLYDRGIECRVIDGNNTVFILGGQHEITRETGKYISILPVLGPAKVSLKGFKYELDGYHMDFGSTIGMSNEIVQDIGYINIEKGRVMVFISED